MDEAKLIGKGGIILLSSLTSVELKHELLVRRKGKNGDWLFSSREIAAELRNRIGRFDSPFFV